MAQPAGKKKYRIILAAGGSGGHIFPAVSLAEEIKKTNTADIFFVSSEGRISRSLLEGAGYKSYFLSRNPMPLSLSLSKYPVFLFKAAVDMVRSVFLTLRLRPHVVVGFGGYSSGAISLVSSIMGVPLVIHEQNVAPGRANIILSSIARRIAVSFSESKTHFEGCRGKVVFTGNPIRCGMLTNDRESSSLRLGISPDKRTVLVMGGSQGSSALNRMLSETALRINEEKKGQIQFLHLSGERDHASVTATYSEGRVSGRVFSFLDRIDDAYASSDLVVSRSGAAAVFELAYYGKPMILVPYPSAKNNQRSNAMYFSKRGAAIYREEKDLETSTIKRDILDLFADKDKMEAMSRASRKLACPEAAGKLAREVLELAKSGSKRRDRD